MNPLHETPAKRIPSLLSLHESSHLSSSGQKQREGPQRKRVLIVRRTLLALFTTQSVSPTSTLKTLSFQRHKIILLRGGWIGLFLTLFLLFTPSAFAAPRHEQRPQETRAEATVPREVDCSTSPWDLKIHHLGIAPHLLDPTDQPIRAGYTCFAQQGELLLDSTQTLPLVDTVCAQSQPATIWYESSHFSSAPLPPVISTIGLTIDPGTCLAVSTVLPIPTMHVTKIWINGFAAGALGTGKIQELPLQKAEGTCTPFNDAFTLQFQDGHQDLCLDQPGFIPLHPALQKVSQVCSGAHSGFISFLGDKVFTGITIQMTAKHTCTPVLDSIGEEAITINEIDIE